MDTETAQQDACRIEHVISQISFEKLREHVTGCRSRNSGNPQVFINLSFQRRADRRFFAHFHPCFFCKYIKNELLRGYRQVVERPDRPRPVSPVLPWV